MTFSLHDFISFSVFLLIDSLFSNSFKYQCTDLPGDASQKLMQI